MVPKPLELFEIPRRDHFAFDFSRIVDERSQGRAPATRQRCAWKRSARFSRDPHRAGGESVVVFVYCSSTRAVGRGEEGLRASNTAPIQAFPTLWPFDGKSSKLFMRHQITETFRQSNERRKVLGSQKGLESRS